jgi:hypothetical protein
MITTGNATHGGPLTAATVPVPTQPIARPGSDIASRVEAARAKRATRAFRLLSPEEPDRMHNPVPAVTTPAPKAVRVSLAAHGTMSAYRTHYRRGEPPCDECREANRQHTRAYRARKAKPGLPKVSFDVEAAIARWLAGESIRSVARAFGVSNPTMQHHVKRYKEGRAA